MMLMAYHRVYGFPAIITRTANIYGPGQSMNRIIPLATDQLRRGEKIHLDGGGESVRCFIHVSDACAATYLLAKKGASGETYHISTWEQHSIYYIVSSICARLGLDADEYLLDAPERLGKDHAYLMQSHKLRALGWEDTITLEQGLEECVSSH
jgi:dTDP-glucose 4,6-dehydratase